MATKLTLRQKQSIFLRNVAKLIEWAFENGYELTGGELHRTAEQHALNVKKGLSKANTSLHMSRLAIDLMLFIDGVWITDSAKYKPLGDFWVSLHPLNRWGGDFNMNGSMKDERFLDGNHFEMMNL